MTRRVYFKRNERERKEDNLTSMIYANFFISVYMPDRLLLQTDNHPFPLVDDDDDVIVAYMMMM